MYLACYYSSMIQSNSEYLQLKLSSHFLWIFAAIYDKEVVTVDKKVDDFFSKTESDHRKFLKRLSIAHSDSDSNKNISNRCNNSSNSNTNSNRNNYNNISNSTNRDINLNIDTLSATAATTSTTTILATTTTTTTSTETISATGAAFTEAAATTGRNKQNMDFKFFAGVSNLFANFFGSWR